MYPTKLEVIREYFMECPFLKDGLFHIDFLSDQPIEYSILTEPLSTPVLRQYTDGSALKQYIFTFASNECLSPDLYEQIQSNGFYEKLEHWLDDQNRKGILPNIPGVQSIQALSPGYLYFADLGVGRYQMQCRVTYFERS